MALSARLEIRQGQGLVITPQLQQAIKLLQLSNLELEAFVEAELEKNPLLQREDAEPGSEAEAPLAATEVADRAEMSFEDGRAGDAADAVDARSDDVYGDAAPGERTSDRMEDVGAGEAQPGLNDWSRTGAGGGQRLRGAVGERATGEERARAEQRRRGGDEAHTDHSPRTS